MNESKTMAGGMTPVNRAILIAAVSVLPGFTPLVVRSGGSVVIEPVPNVFTQSANVPRDTPRSAAMPRNVASGVDSCKSTACRRNSSE